MKCMRLKSRSRIRRRDLVLRLSPAIYPPFAPRDYVEKTASCSDTASELNARATRARLFPKAIKLHKRAVPYFCRAGDETSD